MPMSSEHVILNDELAFPEGPVWLQDGSVLVVEMAMGKLSRVAPDGSKTTVANLGGGPNGAAIGPDGRCYVCNNGGMRFRQIDGVWHPGPAVADYQGGWIDVVDIESGAHEVLYRAWGDVPLSAPNDIVFDTHGGFYFTDSGKLHKNHRDRGAVYYARNDGSAISRCIFPLEVPNGVGLSPDGKMLYVAETSTARLFAYELTAPGEIRKGGGPTDWEHGRMIFARDHYALFDSLAIDAEGNICVSEIPAGKIVVVSPEGRLIEEHRFDDPFTTNICFGGDDLKTAYVTLSSTGKLIQTRWPRAGLAV
jgi:gluconolactonase